MLQLKTDHTFRNRFLFVFLLLTILHGLTAGAANSRLDGAGRKDGDPRQNVTLPAQARAHQYDALLQTGFNLYDVSLNTGYRQQELSFRARTIHRPQEISFRTQSSHHQQALSFRPQTPHRQHFDLNPSHFFLHIPLSLLEDIPEDLTADQIAFISRAHESRHKRRFYISVNSQQYSFTTRLQQLQLLLAQYIPGDENKTGVYQWHDAFLPAYYKFLFRYTLF